MNSMTRLAIASSILAISAGAAAQPYSQADQERRARNREDVLAKHPEAQRQVSASAGPDAGQPRLRDPIAPVGRKAMRASNNFAERQAAKVRRVGKRVENALPPKPKKNQ